MYTRTHPKHTRGTNPFSAISPCITFLVIVVVVVVVGLVTNSLLYYTTGIQASDVMPIPFRALLGRLGRLFDLVWSRLLPFRLTLLGGILERYLNCRYSSTMIRNFCPRKNSAPLPSLSSYGSHYTSFFFPTTEVERNRINHIVARTIAA